MTQNETQKRQMPPAKRKLSDFWISFLATAIPFVILGVGGNTLPRTSVDHDIVMVRILYWLVGGALAIVAIIAAIVFVSRRRRRKMAGIFSGRGKGFLRSALLGVADLPFSVLRSFSDMVSYIRLFAVGYATVVVAVSFNAMAASLASSSWAGVVGAVGILLVGHSLNMLLALMAVMVHGIRLNVLEFSTHLEMGWTGIPYRPFMSSKGDG